MAHYSSVPRALIISVHYLLANIVYQAPHRLLQQRMTRSLISTKCKLLLPVTRLQMRRSKPARMKWESFTIRSSFVRRCFQQSAHPMASEGSNCANTSINCATSILRKKLALSHKSKTWKWRILEDKSSNLLLSLSSRSPRPWKSFFQSERRASVTHLNSWLLPRLQSLLTERSWEFRALSRCFHGRERARGKSHAGNNGQSVSLTRRCRTTSPRPAIHQSHFPTVKQSRRASHFRRWRWRKTSLLWRCWTTTSSALIKWNCSLWS